MRTKRWGGGGLGRADLDDVKREPLTPPKVDSATDMDMIHDITPSSFSPKVWGKHPEWREERRGQGETDRNTEKQGISK